MKQSTRVNKNFLVGYRLFFALLGLSAIVTEIAVLVERGRFVPANFFSYFTIQGNIIAVLTLLLSAVAVGRSSHKLNFLRGAATTYILLVGITFSALLSGIKDAQFTAVPWDNLVLHYIMPVALLADWFMDLPKQNIAFKKALVWVLYPMAYVVYSLIRGHFVDWYPYPFLDPSHKGVGALISTSIGLTILVVFMIWMLVRSGKQDGKLSH